jgi:pyrroloquinoline quinone (PQQ) biosynthesis protein C
MADIKKLKRALNQMANDQFTSNEFQDLLSVPLTMERGRFYVIQNALYTKNRRDCWGYVQAEAPLDVKALVWQHESDELINDPRAGMDHYSLTVKQGEVIGLKREDFENAELPPMVQAAFLAWHHIGVKGPWLSAFTSSQMLERRNNAEIVEGGGMSYRIGKKFEKELGINLKKMISLDVHSTADTDHSDMMDGVYDRHVETQEDYDAVLRGARQCMAVDRAYRGGLAYAMRHIK